MNMDTRKLYHFLELFCQIMLVLFVFLIFWEIFKTSDLGTLAAWHVILNVSGVALYVAEGVQLYRRVSLFFDDTNRTDRVLPHGVVMALGLLHIIIGTALKIKQKEDANVAHFESTHAILGLVSWILMFITAIGGIVLAKFASNNVRALKVCHTILGISAYLLGIIALAFGIPKLGTVPERGRTALIIFMSIYVVYSLIGPCTSLVNIFR